MDDFREIGQVGRGVEKKWPLKQLVVGA